MIRLALERPISTWIACAGLVAIGTFSLFKLPVALLPTLERPSFVVEIIAPDRSREQLLTGLVEPVERRLTSLEATRSLRSETEDGSARITLETDWQTDADSLQIEATRRLEGAGDFRPQQMNVRVTGGDPTPTIEVAVLGGESGGARTLLVEKTLLPDIARLPGAGRIETVGLTPLRVVVHPRAAALAARGVTPAALAAALARVGQTSSAGRVREGASVRMLVVSEEVTSLEALGNLMIPTTQGSTPLSGLASIRLDEVPVGGSFHWNGAEGALLRIYRSPGANAVALASKVRDAVSALAGRTGGGIRLQVVRDRSVEVVAALRELALAAFLGILVGTLILRYMLGQWGPTLALSIVIPASVLTSFTFFHVFGIPLDIVSLAGLSLAGGMLVDNSIVVLESIETARARGASNPSLTGTKKIARAVVVSCVTILIVFLPLIYLRGIARAFFGEQAFAIVSSLGASLLFSLTLTPLLARYTSAGSGGASPGLTTYRSWLERCLDRPFIVLGSGLILTAVSLVSVLAIERELFPRAASAGLRFRYELPPDLTREETDRRGNGIEKRVAAAVEGASILALRGTIGGERERDNEAGRGVIDVRFESAGAARTAIPRLRQLAASLAGVRAGVEAVPSAFSELLGDNTGRLQVIVSAPDERRASALANRVSALLRERGVAAELVDSGSSGAALYIDWHEARLSALRLSREQLEMQVRAALVPSMAGRVSIGSNDLNLVLERLTPDEIGVIPVATVAGQVLPLASLANVTLRPRIQKLRREDQRPAFTLEVRQSPGSPDALELERLVRAISIRADESIRLGGEGLEISEAFAQLKLAFLLSLLLVFLTIAGSYESLVVPPLVMAAVPVAVGGGLLALLLTGQSLNMMSFIGLILLSGIVVNHTIVLIDRIEQLREAGEAEDDAIRDAAAERYRPILMTTLTTLLGMLPLALLGNEGVELRRSLATAVIGGLTTSTFASLLVVPLIHRLVEPLRSRRGSASAAMVRENAPAVE
ncbi:MAG TPA: efflux RND transporter permease subunit [Thermoanaerobaculia bacterium]|nr:efflux RND transporter permease subunit [Thermoanaerobaculia bacterium]